MKALSLRQPWAWLVVHGGKRIENRRWPTNYRGEFLIHAAKGMTENEFDDACAFVRVRFGAAVANAIPNRKELERGGIIGAARIIGVLRPGNVDHATLLANVQGVDVRWHMEEQQGFVLSDVRSMPFTPCRGMLGFFEAGDGGVS